MSAVPICPTAVTMGCDGEPEMSMCDRNHVRDTIDLFFNRYEARAILNLLFQIANMGCSWGKISVNLSPKHPLIANLNNRIQSGRSFGKWSMIIESVLGPTCRVYG